MNNNLNFKFLSANDAIQQHNRNKLHSAFKLLLVLAFTFLLSLGFVSCDKEHPIADIPGTENPDTPDTPGTPNTPNTPGGSADVQGSKILIVYFSRTGYNYPNQWLEIGHTARVAGYIADLTGGECFEIISVVPYPDNYQETVAIARTELSQNARPAIKDKIEDIDKYDTIFIGNPIWHGAAPMIIRTFYESYDLTGKTLIPFTTHAGSGLGDSERLARSYFPNNTILDGLAVQGTNSAYARGDVERWLKRIGIIKN